MSIQSKFNFTHWRMPLIRLCAPKNIWLATRITCLIRTTYFLVVCRVLVVGWALLTLSACQRVDEFAGIKQELAALKKNSQQQARVTAKNEFQLPQPVTYQRLVSVASAQSKSADQKMQLLHPLQAYSLANYQFIGTLTRHQQTVAYLKAPNDMVYQVKRGDILGTEAGEITDITTGQLRVLVNDISKKPPKKRVITMQLREQQ